MKIKPLRDKVILEPMKVEEKTKSGIVLPDTVDKEKPEQGKVIAIGGGRITSEGNVIKPLIKKGDMVLFKKYSADEFKVGEKEFLVISEEDIIGIVEK